MKFYYSALLTLLIACAAASESSSMMGDTYEIVNRSACAARLVLHDRDGKVIENIKYPDLRAGRTERYRLPDPGMRLEAVAVDAMGNACSITENQKILITKLN